MKIFPVRFLSGYDKAKNFMQIIEDYPYLDSNQYSMLRTGIERNSKQCTQGRMLKGYLNNYCTNISIIVKNFMRKHG